MSAFFSGFIGNESERGTIKSREPCSGSQAICLFPAPKMKKTSFLAYTILQTKTLAKIFQEKLSIQNSLSNRHFNSFDGFISVHVIFPNAELLVDCSSSGND